LPLTLTDVPVAAITHSTPQGNWLWPDAASNVVRVGGAGRTPAQAVLVVAHKVPAETSSATSTGVLMARDRD